MEIQKAIFCFWNWPAFDRFVIFVEARTREASGFRPYRHLHQGAEILPAKCNSYFVRDLLTWTPLIKGKECVMSVQLMVIYPPPKDSAEFDRAYLQEHLPYAGPRLVGLGATGVSTKRVLGAPDGKPFAHTISFVAFPNAETAKTCAQSKGGQEALQHAASISTGGPPQFLLIDDAP
jgi:hypothetical protein